MIFSSKSKYLKKNDEKLFRLFSLFLILNHFKPKKRDISIPERIRIYYYYNYYYIIKRNIVTHTVYSKEILEIIYTEKKSNSHTKKSEILFKRKKKSKTKK